MQSILPTMFLLNMEQVDQQNHASYLQEAYLIKIVPYANINFQDDPI